MHKTAESQSNKPEIQPILETPETTVSLADSFKQKISETTISPEEIEQAQWEQIPSFIKLLQEYLPQAPLLHNVIQELLLYPFDTGALQAYQLNNAGYTTDGQLITDYTNGAQIPNRNTFVDNISRKTNGLETNIQNLIFKYIDLSFFKQADNVKGDNNIRSADVIIGNVSANLINNSTRANKILKQLVPGGEIMICRYGGDEFCILFHNIEDSTLREEIYQFLINENDGLTSIEGFFGDTHGTYKMNVQLKQGFKEIPVPEDDIKAKIFMKHLHHGLILDEEEIKSIQSNKVKSNHVKHTKKHRKVERTIESLVNKHAELKYVYGLLQHAIQNMSDEKQQSILSEFRLYIKEIVYDRLLGEKMASIHDLTRMLKNNEVEEVFMLDLKCIKEGNDFGSVGIGDHMIKSFWQQIKGVTKHSTPSLVYVRRGGTFMVVVRKDHKLPSYIQTKLSALNKLKLDSHRFEVATHHLSTSDTNHDLSKLSGTHAFIDELFRTSEDKWYQNIAEKLVTAKPLPRHQQIRFESKENLPYASRLEDIAHNFYYYYFNGKRKIERGTKMMYKLEALKDIYQIAINSIFDIDETLTQITTENDEQFVLRKNQELRKNILEMDQKHRLFTPIEREQLPHTSTRELIINISTKLNQAEAYERIFSEIISSEEYALRPCEEEAKEENKIVDISDMRRSRQQRHSRITVFSRYKIA